MKIAIYPGSFDPITLGHMDIIKRASKIFDKLIVAVSQNRSKAPIFTIEERIELLKKCTKDIPQVEIDTFDTLLIEYVKNKEANVIIRGLRALSDFEYEFQMALTNKKLYNDIETMFLTTSSDYMFLSSSMVKEIASLGGDISGFVPEPILDDIKKRLVKE